MYPAMECDTSCSSTRRGSSRRRAEATIPASDLDVGKVEFSPDGKGLVFLSPYGKLTLWDLQESEALLLDRSQRDSERLTQLELGWLLGWASGWGMN